MDGFSQGKSHLEMDDECTPILGNHHFDSDCILYIDEFHIEHDTKYELGIVYFHIISIPQLRQVSFFLLENLHEKSHLGIS